MTDPGTFHDYERVASEMYDRAPTNPDDITDNWPPARERPRSSFLARLFYRVVSTIAFVGLVYWWLYL